MKTVSVGIVAFNEEKNIRQVVKDVMNQKQEEWKLSTIFIASNGSTDNTVSYVRSIKSNLIHLFENKKREGKPVDEQKIFDACSSDYLIMLDADIRIYSKKVISSLVRKLNEDKKIKLVGGNPRPYSPETFIEKAVYSTFKVLDSSRNQINKGNNIWGCSGQCLAMKKSLYKIVHFLPGIIAEDDFIYLTNLKKSWEFKYCKDAIVYYKLPKTLKDYMRQVFRTDPQAAATNMYPYFGEAANRVYERPTFFYFKEVFKSFLSNPFGTTVVALIRLISKPIIPIVSRNYKLDWFTAKSTK